MEHGAGTTTTIITHPNLGLQDTFSIPLSTTTHIHSRRSPLCLSRTRWNMRRPRHHLLLSPAVAAAAAATNPPVPVAAAALVAAVVLIVALQAAPLLLLLLLSVNVTGERAGPCSSTYTPSWGYLTRGATGSTWPRTSSRLGPLFGDKVSTMHILPINNVIVTYLSSYEPYLLQHTPLFNILVIS